MTMIPMELDAYDKGFDAGYDGDPITANPYQTGTPEYLQWNEGWEGGNDCFVNQDYYEEDYLEDEVYGDSRL